MTDFSFANHLRPTVDQLCGYKRMINLAHRNQVISDLQFCVLLDIPVHELLERKKFPTTEELWGAERVAQELNVPVEHVSVLHAQGRIVGWEESEELVYPAIQFVNGKLFDRVSMLVEPLRAAGFNDKSISLYLFSPVYALGYFSYAHLADESLDHTQWLLGILQTEFINMRRANDYLRNTEGAIAVSSVTNLDKLNKWKNLHSGDVIVSKSGASHALYVDAAAKLEASLGVSFKTIMARTCIAPDSPFPDSWVPLTKIRESLGVATEELDAMLYPAPDSQRWKRVQSGGEPTYHGSYFIFGKDGEIEINYVAQRLEKLLAHLKELGYPHHIPSVDIRLLYLGNVSMRAYANVSPEHEDALVNLLERTIKGLEESNGRKRGKKKGDADEL